MYIEYKLIKKTIPTRIALHVHVCNNIMTFAQNTWLSDKHSTTLAITAPSALQTALVSNIQYTQLNIKLVQVHVGAFMVVKFGTFV